MIISANPRTDRKFATDGHRNGDKCHEWQNVGITNAGSRLIWVRMSIGLWIRSTLYVNLSPWHTDYEGDDDQWFVTVFPKCFPVFTFSHYYWLYALWSFGSKNNGLSVCLCVCLCVCLLALERQNYWVNFNETYHKRSSICLVVCVWVSAH